MIAGKDQLMAEHSISGTGPLAVFTRIFKAQPDIVRETLIALSNRIRPHVPPDLMGRAELVLAELLNNVAQHGSPGSDNPQPTVHLSIVVESDGIACSASDNGGLLPRICLSPQPPEPSTFPEGGFGWFLIGHLTQSLTYFRENGRNFVAFTVPLEAPIPS